MNCGAQIADDCLFCTECGKPVPQGNVCPHCGASVNEDDSFCQNCGKKIGESPESISESPKSTNNQMGKELTGEDAIQSKISVAEEEKKKKSMHIFFITLITIAVIVALIAGGKYGYNAYSDYKKEKEARELFVKDSLEKVRQDSIKLAAKLEAERLEAEKLAKFREKFTIKNILNLLSHPEDKSIAQKCGLAFLYKDTYEVEGYLDEMIKAYSIAYGYEVEKANANDGTMHNYTGKAIGDHSCYFEYSAGRWDFRTLFFSDKADADYFMELLKKHGFNKEGDVFSNQEWTFFPPSKSQRKGWYEIEIRDDRTNY